MLEDCCICHAARRSPFEAGADVMCWPRALRLRDPTPTWIDDGGMSAVEAKVITPVRVASGGQSEEEAAWQRANQLDCSFAWVSCLRCRRWPPRRPTAMSAPPAPTSQ